jgi:hypothetical protein
LRPSVKVVLTTTVVVIGDEAVAGALAADEEADSGDVVDLVSRGGGARHRSLMMHECIGIDSRPID